jgi:zinc transport system permease protein
LTIITFVSVSGFIIIFKKELFLSTYNEELAKIDGIPVVLLNNFFLYRLLSLLLYQFIVGIILVSALLVIPGATARLFAKGLLSMLVFLPYRVISVIAGLLISYEYDIAPGTCIVLVSALIFSSLL